MTLATRGACIGQDPEIFFPTGRDTREYRTATALCKRCPVTKDCLSYARQNSLLGVWGGVLIRTRQAAASGRMCDGCGFVGHHRAFHTEDCCMQCHWASLTERTCTQCQQTLPIDQFAKASSDPTNHKRASWCRDCVSAKKRASQAYH